MTYSDQTVPIGFHQIGCELRKASHILPEESILRRVLVFLGACTLWAARFSPRVLEFSASGLVHCSPALLWRSRESTRNAGTPGIAAPGSALVRTARPSRSKPTNLIARPW